MFEDKYGNLLMSDEVDELSPWEIEELEIHVFDQDNSPKRGRSKIAMV